eukprot:3208383-Rhodomonas_salina.1
MAVDFFSKNSTCITRGIPCSFRWKKISELIAKPRPASQCPPFTTAVPDRTQLPSRDETGSLG